ncbi:MAG: hypothetical protein ACQEWU_07390 [Bacillota bacterium]|uniref:hypothetical protein n=1 Tax=unclassified Virgibacillus TaxID=2620237 RepID=UPI000EF4F9CD|nr:MULTISPECIES: hypothetical protein [unclassified Virgibacillus]MCC2250686.1 hypothetical protein [Virgibacillus sp. AGTR]MDY7045793.1 hypothetical protein [Virgibacillus sp. M23]QRZ17179.1 hypothetical protein JUJ52_15535 [Virgibacillus sp. AGTR]
MNYAEIGLTQQSLGNFITIISKNFVHEESDIPIFEEHGIKILANVKARLSPPNSVTLESPSNIAIEHLKLVFEKLEIVISVDLPHRSIDLPFLPDVSIFGDNPDIRLTMGIEEFIRPDISLAVGISSNLNDGKHNINLELIEDKFKIHSFGVPEDLGKIIEDKIGEEIKRIIPGRVDDIILDVLGNLTKILSLPIPFDNWIVNKIIDSEFIKRLAKKSITKTFKEQHIYSIPQEQPIGEGPYKRNLTVTEIPISIHDGKLIITANLSDVIV